MGKCVFYYDDNDLMLEWDWRFACCVVIAVVGEECRGGREGRAGPGQSEESGGAEQELSACLKSCIAQRQEFKGYLIRLPA